MPRVPIYLLALSTPLIVGLSFILRGPWSYLPLFELFGLVPLCELVLKPSTANVSAGREAQLARNGLYTAILYAAVPAQLILLTSFLYIMAFVDLALYERIGLVTAMGIHSGVIAINVAHELGHRPSFLPQLAARLLLLSTLYGHFTVEHNRGHHKRVATLDDPATARRGEMLYAFWVRSIAMSFVSACRIEAKRLRKAGRSWLHPDHAILQVVAAEVAFTLGIWFSLGGAVAAWFVAASLVGILLLETVNYIEHYGLARERLAGGKYERPQPHHSWNADHPLGRVLLFELTRHSDHHFKASRKYQVLRSFPDAPQLPTGYPAMMLIAFVPPLFFYLIDKRLP